MKGRKGTKGSPDGVRVHLARKGSVFVCELCVIKKREAKAVPGVPLMDY